MKDVVSSGKNRNAVEQEVHILRLFNERDSEAFGEVYQFFYDELLYFAAKMYKDSDLVSRDVLQDLFMKLWIRKDIVFQSLEHIKGYMYTSIRNSFREYLSHQQVKDKYQKLVCTDDARFVAWIVETEVLAELSRLEGILPAECAKVLALYLEGWEIKDIAEKLGKSVSTVYNQRQEVIHILRKLYLKKLIFILSVLFP